MKSFFLSLVISLPLVAGTVYEEIDPLDFDSTGYFATETSLDTIFREHEIRTVIEIGCWAGRSTRFLGSRVGDGGKVYAVDTWLGTPGHRGEMKDPRLSYIYQLFLSNIHHMGLDERVIPLRMSSEEALRALSHVSADLIYIDASRESDQIYHDIIHWFEHLSPDGVLCGAEYREPGVRDGVLRAAQALSKKVESDRKGFFWVLKSP